MYKLAADTMRLGWMGIIHEFIIAFPSGKKIYFSSAEIVGFLRCIILATPFFFNINLYSGYIETAFFYIPRC